MKRLFIFAIAFFLMRTFSAHAQTILDADQPVSIENALSGWSTAIDGNWSVIASPQKDNGASISIGEVSFMEYAEGRWSLRQIVQPAGLPILSNFGYSVDLDAETAAIGSIGDHETKTLSGVVFLYQRGGNVWQELTSLRSEAVQAGDRFGSSLDLHHNLLAVGAPQGDGIEAKSGKVIVFEQDGESWNQIAELRADDGKNGDFFGDEVHIISNNLIAVGSYQGEGAVPESGAVYIFERDGENWSQAAKLFAPEGKSYDVFGYSLASHTSDEFLSQANHLLFIGAPGTDNMNGQTGSVFVFAQSDNEWNLVSEFSHEDVTENAHFGSSISTNNLGDLFVGAGRRNSEDHKQAGTVYTYRILLTEELFDFDSGVKLDVQSELNFNHFGATVRASDEFIMVSSPYDDRNGLTNSGSVFFYGSSAVNLEEEVQDIRQFELMQNYPNPFNPSTVISYQLPVNGVVSLKVFDMLGREVATLLNNERKSAGKHEVTFNAGGLSSGMYIYRLYTGDNIFTKKLTLIK